MITAAGGRNPIRSQLGIALEGSTQTQKRIVVDILGSDPSPESCSEFHCNGKRPVIVVSGVKGRRRYEFMLLPTDSEELVTTTGFILDLLAPFEQVPREHPPLRGLCRTPAHRPDLPPRPRHPYRRRRPPNAAACRPGAQRWGS